jgi:hypothetical protein
MELWKEMDRKTGHSATSSRRWFGSDEIIAGDGGGSVRCVNTVDGAALQRFDLPRLTIPPVLCYVCPFPPARVIPSALPRKANDRVGAMDPFLRVDMKEFLQILDRLTHYLTDEECEDIACIMFVVQQETVLPYEDLDDLSASLAFAKLSTPPID